MWTLSDLLKVNFLNSVVSVIFGFQDELRLDEKITSGNDSLKPREGMKFMHIPHIQFIFSVY